jgi:hypothetical protein
MKCHDLMCTSSRRRTGNKIYVSKVLVCMGAQALAKLRYYVCSSVDRAICALLKRTITTERPSSCVCVKTPCPIACHRKLHRKLPRTNVARKSGRVPIQHPRKVTQMRLRQEDGPSARIQNPSSQMRKQSVRAQLHRPEQISYFLQGATPPD